MEIWIASCPGVLGGAGSECLHTLSLLRQFGVKVNLVPFGKLSPDVFHWCFTSGIEVHEYKLGIFADKAVAHWCDIPFLVRIGEIQGTGKPKCLVHFPCMTTVSPLHLRAHRAGWIDRWGWVSHYQRCMIEPVLRGEGRVPVAFDGYAPYYNPRLHLQEVDTERYSPPTHEFVVGRISRDDPSKFSGDTWDIFNRIDTGSMAKWFLILGFGEKCREAFGDPPIANRHLIPPGGYSPLAFYSKLHCLIHKTGGSRESFGRFAIEAMFAGVPIIVERAYAFPEFITHGETGFLCESSDEMVETASMLARDEPRRKQIIDAARDDVKRLCRPEKCWRPWESLLKEQS